MFVGGHLHLVFDFNRFDITYVHTLGIVSIFKKKLNFNKHHHF